MQFSRKTKFKVLTCLIFPDINENFFFCIILSILILEKCELINFTLFECLFIFVNLISQIMRSQAIKDGSEVVVRYYDRSGNCKKQISDLLNLTDTVYLPL